MHTIKDRTTLKGLRDFFLSRTGEDLRSALAGLGDGNGFPSEGDDWEQAEFAFNKLFVGPMALEAPPYASYYLEPEPRLMGETTLKVRRLYEMAGLESPLQGHLPDDHLGVELDAALALRTAAHAEDALEEPRALWRYYLHEHLAAWLPEFLEKARGADTHHPAVDMALQRLAAWLDRERSATPAEGENRGGHV